MPVVNFASETVFESNTTSGSVALTRAQLQTLVDGNYMSGGVVVYGDDILALDVDLGERIGISDIRYYFSSVSASGTVASGINFYYKDYESDLWVSLDTAAGAGYYTTTSGNFFPQLVRVVHTISGTGVSGTLHEYEVNSNEDIVDYGTDGTLIEKDLQDTPFGTSDPYSIPVYNDGDRTATAYVYVGNTDTDADEMLKISAAQNGTYVGVDDGQLIGTGDNAYNWGSGSFGNNTTAVENDKLVLNSFGSGLSFTKLEDLPIAVDTLERGVVRWHVTDPYKSEVYYAVDNAFRRYKLEDDTDISRAVMPFWMGPRDRFIYDPEADKIYAFDFNNNTTTFYQYDPATDNWTGSLGSFSNSPVNNYPVGSLAFIPSNVLNDGARSIIAMCGTGLQFVNPTTPIRIRLTDHNVNTGWGNLTGFYVDNTAGDQISEHEPVMNLTFQGSNLDAFPTGCQGILWATQTNDITVEWLNYFVIYEGDSNHRWYYMDLSNLPTCGGSYQDANTWTQYNNDTWVYDEANNRVWYVEHPGSQNNSLRLHYFNCDGIWNRCYETMYDPYTVLDPDGWFWYDGSTALRKRNYMDGKVYNGAIYFVCMSGHDKSLMYLFTPGGSGAYYEEGTYTTPVLKNQDQTYWRVKAEIPENTSINTSTGTIESTIEVRSSDTPPTGEDSQLYHGYVRDGDNYYAVAFNYDGTEKWRNTVDTSNRYYAYVLGCTMAINEFYPDVYNSAHVHSFFGWNYRRTGQYFNRLPLSIYNVNGDRIYFRYRFSHTDDLNYYRITNAIFASNNMIYTTYRGIGTESDRIDVLDNTAYWVSTLEFTGDQSTLYSMCLAGANLEDLWIIKEDLNEVRRYNQTLQLQQTVADITTGNLNGICEDAEGGFFVGETQSASRKIHHYDESGTFVATYDVSSHINSIHRMKKDYEGGLWALDTAGEQIARFSSNGEFIGKQSLLSPQGLASTPLGCWVMTEVYDRYYFITPDVTVDKMNTWPDATVISYDGDNWRGAWGQSVERGGEYVSPGYLDSDPHWGSGGDLEWSEVGKDTNFLHHKKYHQARVTLRGDASVTPIVEKIALPPAIELANIPAQGYRNAYLKTVVADGTQRSVQHGKIRTWFDMEE